MPDCVGMKWGREHELLIDRQPVNEDPLRMRRRFFATQVKYIHENIRLYLLRGLGDDGVCLKRNRRRRTVLLGFMVLG